MRVNIYAEELTDRVELVKKPVNQETFYGVRLYLKSHPDLHHSASDNDESAVTIWVPWTHAEGNDFKQVVDLLLNAADLLMQEQSSQITEKKPAKK